ncbi:MAG: hypothetical protein ABI267_01860 [Ginsengibacter sp.]
MAENKKYTIRKILAVSVWIILASGIVVLLVAAMTKKNTEQITGVDIKITGSHNNYFVNKKEVLTILEKVNGKKLEKSSVNAIDLTAMENSLVKNDWIEKAELFFDNNKVLQVKVIEREPIARIFTVSGASFYMDSSLTKLPLSDKFSARLPVFTSFPTDVRVLGKQDSALLSEIKIISEYIDSHPFWMAQIDQVDILNGGTFELIPKLGNQLIHFGDAQDCDQKFNKLLAFYKQVETNVGWNKYSVLDIQYKNQVVGVIRDAAEIKSDSLKTVEIMKSIIAEAEKNANDSTQIQLPQPPDNDDKIIESPVSDNTIPETNNRNKINSKNQSGTGKQKVTNHSLSNEKPNPDPAVKKADAKNAKSEIKREPKAVMAPKSDY